MTRDASSHRGRLHGEGGRAAGRPAFRLPFLLAACLATACGGGGGSGDPRTGPPGTLDTSFNTKGTVVITTHDGRLRDVALLSDGRIVAVGDAGAFGGDVLVVVLTPQGRPDASFSGDGIATFDLGGLERVEAVAIAPGGRIVVAGTIDPGSGDHEIFVMALRDDGSPDPTFNGGTEIITDFGIGGRDDFVADVDVDEQGRILVVGTSLITVNDLSLRRFLASGAPDDDFGAPGAEGALLLLSPRDEFANAVARTASGAYVIVGHSDDSPDRDALAVKLAGDGSSLDATFGAAGRYVLDTLPRTQFTDVVELPDGRFRLAGSAAGDYVVAGLTATGQPAAALGGTVVHPIEADEVRSLLVLPDGRSLVLGSALNPTDLGVLRALVDGSADASFGVGGLARTGIVADDAAGAMVLQPDGQIVAVGDISPAVPLIVRFNGGD